MLAAGWPALLACGRALLCVACSACRLQSQPVLLLEPVCVPCGGQRDSAASLSTRSLPRILATYGAAFAEVPTPRSRAAREPAAYACAGFYLGRRLLPSPSRQTSFTIFLVSLSRTGTWEGVGAEATYGAAPGGALAVCASSLGRVIPLAEATTPSGAPPRARKARGSSCPHSMSDVVCRAMARTL